VLSTPKPPLDHWRQSIRTTLSNGGLIVVAFNNLLFVFERHQSQYHHPWHSTLGEANGWFVLAFGLVMAFALFVSRRFGMIATFVTALLVIGGAFGSLATLFVVHLFETTERNLPGQMAILGYLILVAIGLVILIAEILLRLGQRAQDRANGPAPLPKARVVSS
jgi:hypothetical protein